MTRRRIALASLSVLWCGTGLVSLINSQGISMHLMQEAGLGQTRAAPAYIGVGAWLDLLLGIALWWRPQRAVLLMALACLTGWTLLCSLLMPHYWLHPFGPLLKNLPVAALLWWLLEGAE
jgi:CHASE2 domain-containing sensor protein